METLSPPPAIQFSLGLNNWKGLSIGRVRSRKDLNKERMKNKKDLIRKGGSIEKDEMKYRKGLKKERFKQVKKGYRGIV